MLNKAHKQDDTPAFGGGGARPELVALQARAQRAEDIASDQALFVRLLAELVGACSLERALDSLVSALKHEFDCERVAIALHIEDDLKLKAISQQGVLEAASSEARLLVDAMSEACAQESILCWPVVSDQLQILVAHRALGGRQLTRSLCSVPLYCEEELVGAVLLERRDQRPFPVNTLERLSVGLAPMLELHRKADRGWWAAIKEASSATLEQHLGPDRPGVRLLGILAALTFIGSLTITTQWDIVAPAELLSNERRVVTAPIDGFIADMVAEAGDRVMEGDVLARLDRRELELEAASRESEVVMAEAEFRAAMASYDRQTTGIARARLAQARARREGVEQRLNRTDLTSPIDGLVIASDVTRTSGTAVTRSEVLFEVAPDTGFEVHVLVDEADVYDLQAGQTGMLSLRAMPGEHVAVEVTSISPVAEAGEGENRFRARARLIEPDARLRPGQSGVVRLEGGTSSLLGVMTRRLNRHLSELWWRWIG